MYCNRDRVLSKIKVIRASPRRAERKVDLHDISWESAYRARMEQRFSQPTVSSAIDGSVDSARRKLYLQVTAETKCSPTGVMRNRALLYSCHPPDEARLARLGLEKSDEDGKSGVEDGTDEAQKIRRDMKVRKSGFVGGGSIGGVKVSTNVNRGWLGSLAVARA